MKIASITENQIIEKRIAITPETAKKYISLGFEVILSENYGSHLGIQDEQYKELGAKIINDEKELLNNSMSILDKREADILKARRLSENPKTLEELSEKYDISRERVRQIEVRALEKENRLQDLSKN